MLCLKFVLILIFSLLPCFQCGYSRQPIHQVYNGNFPQHRGYFMHHNYEPIHFYPYSHVYGHQNFYSPRVTFPGGGRPVLVNYHKRCNGNYVGLQSLPQSRQYYFVCNPDSVIFGKCENLQTFDSSAGHCKGFPTNGSPFRCEHQGRFPFFPDCTMYYKCDCTLTPKLYSCPNEQAFNATTSECVAIQQFHPTQISIKGNYLPENCEEKFPPCLKEGVFRSPKDCSLYFKCTLQSDTMFLQTRFKCPSDSFYDIEKKLCLPRNQVNCDCIHLAECIYPKPAYQPYYPQPVYPYSALVAHGDDYTIEESPSYEIDVPSSEGCDSTETSRSTATTSSTSTKTPTSTSTGTHTPTSTAAPTSKSTGATTSTSTVAAPSSTSTAATTSTSTAAVPSSTSTAAPTSKSTGATTSTSTAAAPSSTSTAATTSTSTAAVPSSTSTAPTTSTSTIPPMSTLKATRTSPSTSTSISSTIPTSPLTSSTTITPLITTITAPKTSLHPIVTITSEAPTTAPLTSTAEPLIHTIATLPIETTEQTIRDDTTTTEITATTKNPTNTDATRTAPATTVEDIGTTTFEIIPDTFEIITTEPTSITEPTLSPNDHTKILTTQTKPHEEPILISTTTPSITLNTDPDSHLPLETEELTDAPTTESDPELASAHPTDHDDNDDNVTDSTNKENYTQTPEVDAYGSTSKYQFTKNPYVTSQIDEDYKDHAQVLSDIIYLDPVNGDNTTPEPTMTTQSDGNSDTNNTEGNLNDFTTTDDVNNVDQTQESTTPSTPEVMESTTSLHEGTKEIEIEAHSKTENATEHTLNETSTLEPTATTSLPSTVSDNETTEDLLVANEVDNSKESFLSTSTESTKEILPTLPTKTHPQEDEIETEDTEEAGTTTLATIISSEKDKENATSTIAPNMATHSIVTTTPSVITSKNIPASTLKTPKPHTQSIQKSSHPQVAQFKPEDLEINVYDGVVHIRSSNSKHSVINNSSNITANRPRLEISVGAPLDLFIKFCPPKCDKNHPHKFESSDRVVDLTWYPNKSGKTFNLQSKN